MANRPKIKILLVDDDEDEYFILKSLVCGVTSYCPQVDWAPDYQSARSYLTSARPDLIILDYNLSGKKTGLQLANWLWARGDHVPIIFMTGTQYQKICVHEGIAEQTLFEVVNRCRDKYELSKKSLDEDLAWAISA
jgi:CheY-like chemotaxis protein